MTAIHKSVFVLWMATIIATSAQTMTPSHPFSSDDNSEITERTSRTQRLKDSAAFWTRWYLRIVGIAVAVTALTFVAQFLATKKANELAEEESLLAAAKDRKAARELALVSSEASKAIERAGEANKEAGKANDRAGKPTRQRVWLTNPPH